MAWFLNPALTRFRDEVNARWPRRDKTSDGTIGDAAHQSRTSDHNPDADGSVDAWDMDVDGVPVAELKRVFEAHPASKYWVHNDQICFRDEGWHPRSYAYAGPNRNKHEHHVHWNTREAFENSTAPWFTEDDMPGFGFDSNKVADDVAFRVNAAYGDVRNKALPALTRLEVMVAEALGRDPVDEQAIVDGVLAGLAAKSVGEIKAALQAALPPDTYAQLFPQG